MSGEVTDPQPVSSSRARMPLVAANWKMHLTKRPAVRLIEEIVHLLGAPCGAQVAVCPPATILYTVGRALAGTPFLLGAQTMHWWPEGACTGEISAPMLVDVGCCAVIVGHSERRLYFGETDEMVGKKVHAALAHSLMPIVCVGEDLAQREAGETKAVLTRQVRAAVAAVAPSAFPTLVLAYEPSWAIGTSRHVTGDDVNHTAGIIRRLIGSIGGPAAAARVRILYGESVKPDNVREFLRQPEIDGVLVGSASLDAGAFAAIVGTAME